MAGLDTLTQRLSYIVGENMTKQMQADGIEIDPIALAQAVNDVMSGNPSALTAAQKEATVAEIQALAKAQAPQGESCCSGNDSNCCD